jgi:hypothetical protein
VAKDRVAEGKKASGPSTKTNQKKKKKRSNVFATRKKILSCRNGLQRRGKTIVNDDLRRDRAEHEKKDISG